MDFWLHNFCNNIYICCVYTINIYMWKYMHTHLNLWQFFFYRILSSFEQISLWKYSCIHICCISLAFAMIHSPQYSKEKFNNPEPTIKIKKILLYPRNLDPIPRITIGLFVCLFVLCNFKYIVQICFKQTKQTCKRTK